MPGERHEASGGEEQVYRPVIVMGTTCQQIALRGLRDDKSYYRKDFKALMHKKYPVLTQESRLLTRGTIREPIRLYPSIDR